MSSQKPTVAAAAGAAAEPLSYYGALLAHCLGTVLGCAMYLFVMCVALFQHYFLGDSCPLLPLVLAALLTESGPRQAEAGGRPAPDGGGECSDEKNSDR